MCRLIYISVYILNNVSETVRYCNTLLCHALSGLSTQGSPLHARWRISWRMWGLLRMYRQRGTMRHHRVSHRVWFGRVGPQLHWLGDTPSRLQALTTKLLSCAGTSLTFHQYIPKTEWPHRAQSFWENNCNSMMAVFWVVAPCRLV
jgi:hypothetical protein